MFKIMYLKDVKGVKVGCLAIDDTHDIYASYQLSVLNPTDKFNKEVSRHLALGRLLEKPFTIRVGGEKNRHDVTKLVMRALVKNSAIPSRARKAAALWLRTANVKHPETKTDSVKATVKNEVALTVAK
jgi:hypothetical protein